MTATLTLRNARPYGGGDPLDVVVRDGRIARVAPAGAAGDAGEVLDVAGRWIGPGLWDAHVHFTQWVVRRRRGDLTATSSAADVLEVVARALASDAPRTDGVLVGYGFRDGLWSQPASQAALDRAAGGVPVVLVSGDLHCAWLTSSAAQRLSVHPDETGIVREGDWIGVADHLDETGALTVEAFRDAADAAARRGVVGIVDYEIADAPGQWRERADAGVTGLRVEAAVWPDRLEAAIAAGRRTGDVLDERGLVRMGPLKVVVDGSLNTRTAWCWDPYPGLDRADPHSCGIQSVSLDELDRLLARARDNGLAAAVHAIGDRANSEVLDAFARAGVDGVIEHAQLVREEDFVRFARLGLVASVQPEHAMDDRDIADHHWAGRTGRAFAFGSLHRAGATLRLGSDAPVAPLDPWQAIASATQRSRGDREPWHPEQNLPLDVALAASARSTVSAGEVADLVLVEADPYACDRDALRALPVAATMLDGRFTWSDL